MRSCSPSLGIYFKKVSRVDRKSIWQFQTWLVIIGAISAVKNLLPTLFGAPHSSWYPGFLLFILIYEINFFQLHIRYVGILCLSMQISYAVLYYFRSFQRFRKWNNTFREMLILVDSVQRIGIQTYIKKTVGKHVSVLHSIKEECWK